MIGAAVALAVTAAVGPVARWLGERVGALDYPSGGIKPHPRPVSYLGGLAVAAGVVAGLVSQGWPVPWPVPVAALGLALLGLADDTAGVPGPLRLGAQVGVGLLLAAVGPRAAPFDTLAFDSVLTVLLFVGAVNAVNIVDGMDGLASSTAALSGIALLALAAIHGRAAPLAIVIAGTALGFLAHNFPPARLFLGNSGSYLLGASLAASVLMLSRSPALFVGAGTCLGFFGLDLLLSLSRRALGRENLFGPDRLHFYDQLLARGLSVRRCLAVCVGLHAALVALGVLIGTLPAGAAIGTGLALWLGVLAALAALGFITRVEDADAAAGP